MTVYVLTIIDAMKIIVMLTISCLVGMSVGLLFCKILRKNMETIFMNDINDIDRILESPVIKLIQLILLGYTVYKLVKLK